MSVAREHRKTAVRITYQDEKSAALRELDAVIRTAQHLRDQIIKSESINTAAVRSMTTDAADAARRLHNMHTIDRMANLLIEDS
jgi:hypothetical protein